MFGVTAAADNTWLKRIVWRNMKWLYWNASNPLILFDSSSWIMDFISVPRFFDALGLFGSFRSSPVPKRQPSLIWRWTTLAVRLQKSCLESTAALSLHEVFLSVLHRPAVLLHLIATRIGRHMHRSAANMNVLEGNKSNERRQTTSIRGTQRQLRN